MGDVINVQKIVEHLYFGIVEDVGLAKERKFSILGAAKEPFHRKHAKLKGFTQEGYMGRAMPQDEPEYLYAERDHALYLNLIDARDMKYIPDEVINKALDFIDTEIKDGRDILIACNKGESRSPSIALMWLIKNGIYDCFDAFSDIMIKFTDDFCRNYDPSDGMHDYVYNFWVKHKGGK